MAMPKDARLRELLLRMEQLRNEEVDEVWTESRAQYEALSGNGEGVDVASCFENALDLVEAKRRNAAG